jgi:hypothetical protein
LRNPITTIKRWANEGMPVERKGRYVIANKEQLAFWLGEGNQMRASVFITLPGEDLTFGLHKALAAARNLSPRGK